MPLKLRIKELLEEASKRRGDTVTQEELANAIGIHPTTMSRYSKNFVDSYNKKVLIGMLEFFEVTPAELFEWQPESEES